MKKSALILASVLALAGCTKKNNDCVWIEYDAWHLPKVVNEYLPYQEGQQLLFLHEYGDTLRFEVRSVRLVDYDTAHYTYKTNPCYPTGDILESAMVQLIRMPESYLENQSKQGIELQIYGAGTENGGISWLEYWMFPNMYPTFQNHNIHSERYNGDVALLGDTISMDRDNKDDYMTNAILVKGKGLVSFHDDRDNGEWLLVEE